MFKVTFGRREDAWLLERFGRGTDTRLHSWLIFVQVSPSHQRSSRSEIWSSNEGVTGRPFDGCRYRVVARRVVMEMFPDASPFPGSYLTFFLLNLIHNCLPVLRRRNEYASQTSFSEQACAE
jgi:hypothetical protein